jgi:protein-disulfide isomerase
MDEHTTAETETTTKSMHISPKGNSYAIPAAIVVGFALIAAAIFFSGNDAPLPQNNVTDAGKDTNIAEIKRSPIKPIDKDDHIKGNPNAPIVVLTYTDFDCPYCKKFHETMNQIMSAYGKDGKVAWVYRHSPIPQLHPSAPRIAQASECVAKLGGSDGFWKFADLAFGERGTNEPTNTSRLTEFATEAGVSATAFDSCLEDEQTKPQVSEDIADAVNAGVKGTPYSLVLVGGQQGVINGAQPYEYVSSVLDTLIAQIEGKETKEVAPAQ